MREDDEDNRIYKVVLNHEEQYSIWLADRELPNGWRHDGKTASKAECLAHIREAWTDMRPRSLRESMAEDAVSPVEPAASAAARTDAAGGGDAAGGDMDELVERLQKPQAVTAAVRPDRTAARLKEQIDRGHVFVRFVETGTEIGVRLDRAATDVAGADFEAGRGQVGVVGELTLNGNRVRCVAQLDLARLEGTGRLEFLGAAEGRH